MGQKLRTPKGEISITNSDGRIRLRWRYGGERYSLNLPFVYLPENLHYASVKVAEIKLDILKGCFDTSLKKYEYQNLPKPIKDKEDIAETHLGVRNILLLHELASKFDHWGKNIRNIDVDNSVDYLYIRKWLERCDGIPIHLIAQKLNDENWAITTYNRRLSYLNTFFSWLLESSLIVYNPLKNVCKKKGKGKKICSRRKPLEENEIITLLEAIKNDTYCPVNSRFKHSFYFPFLTFVFFTGVRNAEAIGLRVKHIDFMNNQIEVSETFARTIKGTNHAARRVKGTKMNNIRYLPLSEELRILLELQVKGKTPDDFVFKSPNGLSIDDKMFKRRVFKPVLMKLGLGDRDLYVARHSFGTRAVQQGLVLTDVAYLMGHSTVETTMRNYVSVAKATKNLPTLYTISNSI
ncbi:MAG: tyrosine-type recombinase/integrase [Chitinophagaceae bacterium]|nr:tyrosine-type recombinase/integrase [Chitinophagaceae bacterium]